MSEGNFESVVKGDASSTSVAECARIGLEGSLPHTGANDQYGVPMDQGTLVPAAMLAATSAQGSTGVFSSLTTGAAACPEEEAPSADRLPLCKARGAEAEDSFFRLMTVEEALLSEADVSAGTGRAGEAAIEAEAKPALLGAS